MAVLVAGALLATRSQAGERGQNRPGVWWYVPTTAKVVALTFDDGPNPPYTGQILAALTEAHARATFFVLGRQVVRYPQWVRAEVAAGMEVGNHSWSHENLRHLSEEAIRQELQRTQDAVHAAAGVTPTWMRPPYGAFGPATVKVNRALGLSMALWSWTEDSRDWANPGPDAIVRRVMGNLQPGDIVLFHDGGGDRSQTVAALRIILADLEAQGWRAVTLTELLAASDTGASSPGVKISRSTGAWASAPRSR
ncbi:MAG: polysaccharide deacetylase family protein [Firmicutes bacterium]|nr:polysaccharide deacetylase family protein [Alicyclobacillaceae bacterium]MCL6496390.1 polysaccharide deacetylase family protein [Bacillota bacterium]